MTTDRALRAALLASIALLAPLSAAPPPEPAQVLDLVTRGDFAGLKALGPGVLDPLVRLYPESPPAVRAEIANAFYFLGWESDQALRVLLPDAHTADQRLRLSVQWALGRVSDSPVVVEVLLENMTEDANPLFRDKAACALAYDQIHLSELQKVRLFEGLIAALSEAEPQVRAIAIQALEIHTGQRRGFAPGAPEAQRAAAVESWRRWLEEYRAQL